MKMAHVIGDISTGMAILMLILYWMAFFIALLMLAGIVFFAFIPTTVIEF